MSALGQKQTCAVHNVMSALPPKADMCGAPEHVRFVPIADILLVQTSVDLKSELLDNRRPESNVSGEGPAQFFRVRIENWFNAGVD